jgi:hypothetical protein
MKKKRLLFLIAPLVLSGTASGSSFALFGEIKKASTSYVDVIKDATGLTSASFYLFGAYSEESGTPYVYLMSYPGYGSSVKVPCLSKNDTSHPCGINQDDFFSSCLDSIIYVSVYGSTYQAAAFTKNIAAFYIDSSASYAFAPSTTQNQEIVATIDSTSTPSVMTLNGYEYQIANNSATWKGYATPGAADSGYSTDFLAYPVDYSLFRDATAVGFAKGLASSAYTAETAVSAYQSLPYFDRQLFLYYRNTYQTTASATQAVEKILIDGVTSYVSLEGGVSNENTMFKSKTPSATVDYATDTINGLTDSEQYRLTYGSSSITSVYSSNGTLPLAGSANGAEYDLGGQDIEIEVFGGAGYNYMDSDPFALTILPHASAPTPGVNSLSLPISDSASENVNGIYAEELSFAPESGMQYLCLSADTTFSLYEAGSYQWLDTPDFTTLGNSTETALTPETSYLIFKRVHSTTAPDSLPQYDEASGSYVGTSVTTLTKFDSMKKRILVSNYQIYQDKRQSLNDGAEATNLANMLLALRKKVDNATSIDDLATFFSDVYSSEALSFAEQQDAAIASIKASVALTASDSNATETLLNNALAQISALDYFTGATPEQITSLQTEVLWKSEAFRYREGKGKNLVDFFNSSILSSARNLPVEKVNELWSLVNSSFMSLITSLGSDLSSSKAAADAAYSSATSALSAKLQELLG